MDLLERREQLAVLETALEDATEGQGRVVVVTGEAGAGKTSLLRVFGSDLAEGRLLWGMCDDLNTPRPLGPFRDIATDVGERVAKVIESGSVAEFPDALLEELDEPPRPVVLAIDDAQWADEATLDVIRFVGRRVDRLRVLVMLAFRDDEVPSDHPLRVMLGSIPTDSKLRVELPPLSPDAVRSLAGSSYVDDLYRLTGGNPFYVREMLAEPDSPVPTTVEDAVMARFLRLDEMGRQCAETTSVVPTRVERWLLEDCGVASGLDNAERFGVLEVDDGWVRFSHELVRRAVERALSPTTRQRINGKVLEVLVAHDADPARIAHHASQANDTEAVARFAPIAARRAVDLDSHREAVTHFRQALEHPDTYPRAELGALWYEYARECWTTDRHSEAVKAVENAIEIHTEVGDKTRLGRDLVLLSEAQWFLGRGEGAVSSSMSSISVLEKGGEGVDLARAYAQRAKLAMVDRQRDEAIGWGEKAIAMARRFGDVEVLAHALNTVGASRWMGSPSDNGALLESLELARAKGLTTATGRAYHNIADGYVHHMDYVNAGKYLEEGLAFCSEWDLVTGYNSLLALRSLWNLEQGHWAEADEDARRSIAAGSVIKVTAMTALARLLARRGEPAAEGVFEEAQIVADGTSNSQSLIPLGLARLEFDWLGGDRELDAVLARKVFGHAMETGAPRWVGEASLCLHRAGILDEPPQEALEPYALHIAGEWREAAAAWARLGRPYEEADVLADASEPEALLAALETLHRLGAPPRAAMVRARLREMGVTNIPRGPRAATRDNPAGLTAREREILELMPEDLTYEDIAERLYISPKTVDHHVSAVRLKLGVNTRRDAVEEGRRLGIIPEETQ